MLRVAITMLLMSWASLAFAQDSSTMPDEIRSDLDFLVGQWKSTAEYHGETVNGEWSARWSREKVALIIEAESKIAGSSHRSTAVLGYDSTTGRIRDFAFANTGETRLIEYTRTGDAKWAGVSVGSFMGKPFDYSVKLAKVDAATWTYEVTPVAEPTVIITFTRK